MKGFVHNLFVLLLKVCLIGGVAVLVTGIVFNLAGAQTMDARASSALEELNTGGEIFAPDRLESTASAFTTDAPPQTGISATTIEDDTLLKLLSDGDDTSAYNLVQERPRYDLEPTDPRLDPAKWAATVGVDVTGDLQTGTSRSCTFRDYGSVPPIQRTCDRFRNFEEPSCKITLEITADGDLKNTSACTDQDENPLCAPTALACLSGAQTRVIDGIETTRLCWEWQQDYICHADGQFSNCTPYETTGCAETASTCLATGLDGACSHETVSYQCGNPDAQIDQACSAVEVCQGDVCEGIPVERDVNFAQAATWLNLASETAQDNNLIGVTCGADQVANTGACSSADIRFFAGTRQTCRSSGVLRNCCKGSGIATNLLGGCNAAEVEIQNGIASGTVHYVGEYCAVRVFACITRKRAFCNFNSKIARVFQEQARIQNGTAWLGAKNEPCEGLTHEDMAALDYEQIDLSELFSGMLDTVGISNPQEVEDRLLDRLSGYASSLSGDLVAPQADPNFDEDNVVAITDPITGEVSYLPDDPDADDLTYTAIPDVPRIGSGPVSLPDNPDPGVGNAIEDALEEGTAQ